MPVRDTSTSTLAIDLTLTALLLLIGSCLITLMAVFLGARSPALGLALIGQGLAVLPAAAAGALALWALARRGGPVLARLWAALPGWLIFAFAAINSLVAMGELAFFMMRRASGRSAHWTEHAPLVCALVASISFCALFALRRSATDGDEQGGLG